MKKRSIILAALMITAAISVTACGSGSSAKTESAVSTSSSVSETDEVGDSSISDSETEEETSEDVHSEGLEDHSLGNAYGGKEIVVKTWIGENTTYDDKDEDGNIKAGSSLANNVSIAYEVSEASDKDAKALIQEKVENDCVNKKSYLTYEVTAVREDGDKVWAFVNYGDDTVKSESILFVQKVDDKSVLSGEIQYYKELAETYADYKATDEDIKKVQDAYGFTVNGGTEVDFSKYNIQTEYELKEIEIPGKDNKPVSKAYTWDDNTTFMMDYSDPETNEESAETDSEEGKEVPVDAENVEEVDEDYGYEDAEDEYINGFSTGMKGTYESVEVYQPKEAPNAKTIVQKYVDDMQYFAPEGTKISDVNGDEKIAHITLSYPAEDGDAQSTVIYAVFAEDKVYKAITIESTKTDNKYFKDLLDVYKLEVTEAKNEVDVYDYDEEEEFNEEVDATQEEAEATETTSASPSAE